MAERLYEYDYNDSCRTVFSRYATYVVLSARGATQLCMELAPLWEASEDGDVILH